MSDSISAMSVYASQLSDRLLTADEECALVRRWQELGDDEARDELVEHNQRLVIKVARGYPERVPLPDRIQMGNLGLLKAIDRFKPELGNRFSTYAIWWIRQAVQRGVLNDALIRLPAHMSDEVRGVRKLLGEEAGPDQHPALYLQWRAATITSYDRELAGTDGLPWIDTLEDTESPGPEDACAGTDAMAYDDRMRVRAMLTVLPPKLRKTLEMRFGFGGVPMTLEEVGNVLGVSRERVRQLQDEAVRHLQVWCREHEVQSLDFGLDSAPDPEVEHERARRRVIGMHRGGGWAVHAR